MKLLLIYLSVLTGILSGDYTPKTLSSAEQDSILNQSATPVDDEFGMSPTRYRLECENEERLFRHSRLADWFIVDTHRKTRKALGAGLNLGKVRDPQLSPNGRYIVFAKDNNLYLHKLDFGTEVAVTKDENPDIINGISDWLYEEEFGTTALYAWSPDSKQVAFVKLNETEVPDFSWQTFLGEPYPSSEHLRYPKAGCPNAQAAVYIYDVPTKGIVSIPLANDGYLPRLRWTENGELIVLTMNRDQNKMEVYSCNPKSTVSHLLYKEESNRYFIDYTLFDQWQWLSDGRFVMLSEKDGFRRAYLYSAQGFEQKALTPENMDVTALYAVDAATQTLYYQAAPTPATRQIYALSLKNPDAPIQLSEGEGAHAARFSTDTKKMIDCYQSFETPNRYTLYRVDGKKKKIEAIETLLDNDSIAEAWRANNIAEPRLLRIPTPRGQELEAMLLQSPISNFKSQISNSKSPLVVMHYSGPQSQRVLNRWRKRFEYALVEAGYAVLIVDVRGSDCRGRAWRNETYMSLGEKEAEDLISAAQWAGQQDGIDPDRIALMGWSYGGYQTLYTMSTKGHPFKAGVAIAPVTDWKLYDSAYTERYMRRPQVNDRGYESASLLNKASDLSGIVLIIHGTADDNVHVQHVMQYFDALVQADKHFEMQLYPDDNHHLRKGNNAQHMHHRILRFLTTNL